MNFCAPAVLTEYILKFAAVMFTELSWLVTPRLLPRLFPRLTLPAATIFRACAPSMVLFAVILEPLKVVSAPRVIAPL